ncbi:hypothetical protein [Roseateles paludis]|uniref:Class II aldolase/adducin N-terminal domain-containing protein n=1 Tax=Roseateles paludis TaxID=3145238 RepID=A0ABV0FZN8_9BURK
MSRQFYSLRKGTNPNLKGLPLKDVLGLFVRLYNQLNEDGYFHEAFGFVCVDMGDVPGTVRDPELEMLLTIRKTGLWPVNEKASLYSEDDFFDVIEFLYQYVSKPIDGAMHSHNQCGMHWETFSKTLGQLEFRNRVNAALTHYAHRYELSSGGEVLHKPEAGFEPIFDADLPSKDQNITSRVGAAVLTYRRHGSTLDDRRQAVRDLADVLEYLRPQVKSLLTNADEKDLFNIANNFGVRHHEAPRVLRRLQL